MTQQSSFVKTLISTQNDQLDLCAEEQFHHTTEVGKVFCINCGWLGPKESLGEDMFNKDSNLLYCPRCETSV